MPRQAQVRRRKREKYCFCDRRYDGDGFMIQCERCDIWFHGRCVKITKEQAEKIDVYFCNDCLQRSNGQCSNPDCNYEARGKYEKDGLQLESKYCSDECGLRFNRKRFESIFLPKWNSLKNDPSIMRERKVDELNKIVEGKVKSMENIRRLKEEKEQLERTITAMKIDATRIREQNQQNKEKSIDEDFDQDDDDSDEAISSDQTKTFCVICGVEQLADKAFKHWMLCHKRQESQYNFTSDVPMNTTLFCDTALKEVDPDPRIYCEKEDKKTKRFCMHIESACPQHSNWQNDKDEVCACPLEVMQELKVDGNYCLELKKDCNLHYNWDRFRVTMKNVERLQEFAKFAELYDKERWRTLGLRDTYGGVVGIMLHETKNFRTVKQEKEEDDDDEMIDVN